jgi:hypothetical protein
MLRGLSQTHRLGVDARNGQVQGQLAHHIHIHMHITFMLHPHHIHIANHHSTSYPAPITAQYITDANVLTASEGCESIGDKTRATNQCPCCMMNVGTHLHVEETKASLALHLSRVQHNGLHIRGQSLNLRLACMKKSKLRSQRFTLAQACFVHSGARAGRVRWDEVVDGGASPTPCFQPLLQCAATCSNRKGRTCHRQQLEAGGRQHCWQCTHNAHALGPSRTAGPTLTGATAEAAWRVLALGGRGEGCAHTRGTHVPRSCSTTRNAVCHRIWWDKSTHTGPVKATHMRAVTREGHTHEGSSRKGNKHEDSSEGRGGVRMEAAGTVQQSGLIVRQCQPTRALIDGPNLQTRRRGPVPQPASVLADQPGPPRWGQRMHGGRHDAPAGPWPLPAPPPP